MAEHNVTGKWGEKEAHDLLASKGYALVEKNWRMGSLEIDIIAMRGNRIIFIEVKTRSTDVVDPLQAIDRKRINHLCRAADAYMQRYDIPMEAQFDLIFIIGDRQKGDTPRIEHIEDAFLPPLKTYR